MEQMAENPCNCSMFKLAVILQFSGEYFEIMPTRGSCIPEVNYHLNPYIPCHYICIFEVAT